MKKVPPISDKEKAEPSPNRYRDRVVILVASAVMGAILSAYGYRGGIMEGATHIEFIIICWLYFLPSCIVLLLISKKTVALDKTCAWDVSFYRRAVLQLFYCWFAPTAVVFMVFLLSSFILPLSLRESTFLHIDIYIVALLLLLVNACYVIAFYMKQADSLFEKLRLERNAWEEEADRKNAAFAKISAEERKIIQSLKEQIVVLQTKLETYKDAVKLKTSGDTTAEDDKVYLHKLGATTRRIMHGEIALFFMRDGIPWFGLKNGEEHLATEKTLSEVHKAVGDDFFLVKRSYLINNNAIERCVRRSDKRLVLFLCDKQKTEVLGPVEPDENLEKRILKVVDILAERKK